MDRTTRKPRRIDRRTLLRSAVVATAGLLGTAAAGPGRASATPGAGTPVELRGTASRWGGAAVSADGAAIDVTTGARSLFPKIARLPVSFPPLGAAWRLAATVDSRLAVGDRPMRRDIEDYALSFADGRAQLWFGGPRTPGLRLLIDGLPVAAAAAFALPAGLPNVLSLAVDTDGSVTATAGGATLAGPAGTFAAAGLASGGPIDLVVRVGPARWTAVVGSGVIAAGSPGAPWRRRPGEPAWDPREAIGYGYQPQPTHLWNRWTAQLLPTPDDYRGLPAWRGAGRTPVTHGPLLGLPTAATLGVMVRTATPATLELRGGTGTDPAGWRTLATFATAADAGNTGFARLTAGAFAAGAATLHYGIAADGVLADMRTDGAWPVLQRHWLTVVERATARLAVTHCDNFYPAVAPLLSPHWAARAAGCDLLLHLGDHVYEQGFRRRAAVSRLDHFAHFAPDTAQAWRGRLLPTVGLFDDHDLYNDIAATGEIGRFANMTEPDGPEFPPDMPWRIASRDIGRSVWEEWVGWGTPQDSPHAVINGSGRLVGGVLVPEDMAPWRALDAARVVALAPLIVRPDSVPKPPWTIAPAAAGRYRVVAVDVARGLVRLDPAPLGDGPVSFGVSTPRYGSLRLGNAELLLLDTRTMRTAWRRNRDDPRAGMLGPAQRGWLLGRIRQSTADVLLVASSSTVSFANEAGAGALAKRDSWTGYRYERDQMLAALAGRGGPAVLLTGDLHTTAVRRLAPGLHEVICGAWSNIGYYDLVEATQPVAGFPAAGMLWQGPLTGPDADWASWASFVTTARDGTVALEIVDLAADRTVRELQLR